MFQRPRTNPREKEGLAHHSQGSDKMNIRKGRLGGMARFISILKSRNTLDMHVIFI